MEKRSWIWLLVAAVVIVVVAVFARQPRLPQERKVSVFEHRTGQKKVMPIEEYIEGVVAGEMKPGWPKEAYAAQAIVARSFTMEYISGGGAKKLHGTDVSTDETETQAYNEKNITPVIREAVKKTRGQVLTYNNKYIKGWFNAACGGTTARAKEGIAFPGTEPPYTVNKPCPEAKFSPPEVKHWTATYTYAELTELLKELKIGKVRKLEIGKKSAAGRVESWRIVHSGGTTELAGQDLRIHLDPMRLRSNVITELSNEKNKVTIAGKGFGHGVGLCQWGAYTLAKEGKKAKEIALYYFPNTKLEKRWR